MSKILASTCFNLQRGFGLVTAIFLLVLLAGLGVAMLTLSTVQHQSSALDILGSRAYQASRAGIEWAGFQVVQSSVLAPPSGMGGFTALCQAASTSSSVSLAGTLSDFSVMVSCNAASSVENTNTVWMYEINSTAIGRANVSAGSPDYVERQMTVTIAQ